MGDTAGAWLAAADTVVACFVSYFGRSPTLEAQSHNTCCKQPRVEGSLAPTTRGFTVRDYSGAVELPRAAFRRAAAAGGVCGALK